MKLRIATYNIHKGVSTFRSLPRIHALKHAVNAMEADFVFLQEVQGRHDWHAARHAQAWPQEAQHEFLAGDSHHSAYGMNAVYDHGHHGNALLSSYPINAVRNQDVSDHIFEQRGILHCMVQVQECIVHCYVVHLGLFAGGRRRQTRALIDAVQSSARGDDPVIIAGDFNDWGNQLSPMLRNSLGVAEVFDDQQEAAAASSLLPNWPSYPVRPARTFPAAFPCLPLDRIYVRGFAVDSARVLHGPQWAKLSDHAPIVVNVQLN
ncbi:MAG: endonuclease/exonuclease/phosphatase family protein [Burkholderiaceae bacterium]|nr:endonuclease/exonuclease/phosphatase family protein [Burkholderiaceae bacterium]